MKVIMVIFAIFGALFIFDTKDVSPMDLEQFQWKNRLLFLFAPDSNHVLFKNLQSEIAVQKAEVEDRDLVIFEILVRGPSRMNTIQLDRQTADAIRDRFAVPQDAFTLILVGKDGGIKLNRDDQTSLKQVFGLIDSMPMRRNEMRQKNR